MDFLRLWFNKLKRTEVKGTPKKKKERNFFFFPPLLSLLKSDLRKDPRNKIVRYKILLLLEILERFGTKSINSVCHGVMRLLLSQFCGILSLLFVPNVTLAVSHFLEKFYKSTTEDWT